MSWSAALPPFAQQALPTRNGPWALRACRRWCPLRGCVAFKKAVPHRPNKLVLPEGSRRFEKAVPHRPGKVWLPGYSVAALCVLSAIRGPPSGTGSGCGVRHGASGGSSVRPSPSPKAEPGLLPTPGQERERGSARGRVGSGSGVRRCVSGRGVRRAQASGSKGDWPAGTGQRGTAPGQECQGETARSGAAHNKAAGWTRSLAAILGHLLHSGAELGEAAAESGTASQAAARVGHRPPSQKEIGQWVPDSGGRCRATEQQRFRPGPSPTSGDWLTATADAAARQGGPMLHFWSRRVRNTETPTRVMKSAVCLLGAGATDRSSPPRVGRVVWRERSITRLRSRRWRSSFSCRVASLGTLSCTDNEPVAIYYCEALCSAMHRPQEPFPLFSSSSEMATDDESSHAPEGRAWT
ncbi:hypothetical protein NDU88_001622 [Pleurodeles waltl]|uniref:Uncharacterized protein n=1 Tax=Pleurodeles waltl TaxID=8319 RepID=A0AAV7T0E8_PLEWA|nr:hypothetical protein NDU88_001622 [Pleurodeles waltl]